MTVSSVVTSQSIVTNSELSFDQQVFEQVPMQSHLNSEYPSVEHLRAKAKSRMPAFAYDYLAGGCFSEVNLARNSSDIRKVQLKPWYLRDFDGADQKTELFGETYDAPFGVAPVGCIDHRLSISAKAVRDGTNETSLWGLRRCLLAVVRCLPAVLLN